MWLPSLVISLAVSFTTLALVVVLLRRQRHKLEQIVHNFGEQNVTMARRLTEIMLTQQKKQDAAEEAIEKVAGYAIRMRKDINILAERAFEEDDSVLPGEDDIKRVH